MSLKIRLSRGGARKRPMYRIVVADSRAPRDGRFIERVGHYRPLLAPEDPQRLVMDVERVRYWLDQGARPTDRIAVFLRKAESVPVPTQAEDGEEEAAAGDTAGADDAEGAGN